MAEATAATEAGVAVGVAMAATADWGGRWRRNGSHGSNGSYGGNGSHGGYNNGCGSNGGSYEVSSHSGGAYYGEGTVHSAQGQSETRYYGQRNGESTAAPAPIHMEGEQSSNRPEIATMKLNTTLGTRDRPRRESSHAPESIRTGASRHAQPSNTPGVERGTGT